MLILFVGEPNARAALPRLVASASRRTRRGVDCWVMHTNPTYPALRLGYRVPNSELCEPAPPFSFRLAAFQGCYLRRVQFSLCLVSAPKHPTSQPPPRPSRVYSPHVSRLVVCSTLGYPISLQCRVEYTVFHSSMLAYQLSVVKRHCARKLLSIECVNKLLNRRVPDDRVGCIK